MLHGQEFEDGAGDVRAPPVHKNAHLIRSTRTQQKPSEKAQYPADQLGQSQPGTNQTLQTAEDPHEAPGRPSLCIRGGRTLQLHGMQRPARARQIQASPRSAFGALRVPQTAATDQSGM